MTMPCETRPIKGIGQARTSRMGQTLLLKTESWQRYGSECDSIDLTALCKMASSKSKSGISICLCVRKRMRRRNDFIQLDVVGNVY